MQQFWYFYLFVVFGLAMASSRGNLSAVPVLFISNFIIWLIPALIILAIINRNKKAKLPEPAIDEADPKYDQLPDMTRK